MTTEASVTEISAEVFQEIDAEHRELERTYEAIREFLADAPEHVDVLRKSLAELSLELSRHFKREEDGGYFTDIIDIAPRLSHQATALESEHEKLLIRLQQLEDRLNVAASRAEQDQLIHHDLPAFINACRTHEHRETELVQEAWLTDIGIGD